MFKILRTDINTVDSEMVVDASGLDGRTEESLKESYKKCLDEARAKRVKSIAIPFVSLGDDEYSREMGMLIAVDAIKSATAGSDLSVTLVVPGARYSELDYRLMGRLKSYMYDYVSNITRGVNRADNTDSMSSHRADTFSEYLLHLAKLQNLSNEDVYKRAIVTKQKFSSVENDVNYHPTKQTALRYCVGAKLNLSQSKDLLAKAGYALSPCDKTDIIFSFYIENNHYDLIDIDLQLGEYGQPCLIR